MRIAVQSQLLVMLCFCTSLASFFLIGWQFSETTVMQKQRASIALDKVQVNHLQSMLSQWMVTLDLFYYNRQSYLVPGISQQSLQLKAKLDNIQCQEQSIQQTVTVLTQLVNNVSDLVTQSAQNISETSEPWLTVIQDMDDLTTQMITHYELLQSETNALQVKAEIELAQQQHVLMYSFVVGIALTVGILFLLGLWNSRKIIRPLMKLSEITENSQIQYINTATSSTAPHELVIIEKHLVGAFRHLAEGKLKAESDAKKIEQQNLALQKSIKHLEETRRQLVQTEKLAAIGRLAAGVAHEINNPIGYVNSNLETLQDYMFKVRGYIQQSVESNVSREELSKTYQEHDVDFIISDVPELLLSLSDGLKRVARIVQDLRVFSEVGTEESVHVSVQQLLEQALSLSYSYLSPQIQIEKKFYDTPLINACGSMLIQVFINLIRNAADAMVDKGTLLLTVSGNDETVMVSISDSGIGIPNDHIAKIFDPFFTTKKVGEGIGLGLHMCHSIVDNHGGDIVVDSAVGKGSTFSVRLPTLLE